jgi:hypothetical protein
VGYLAYRVDSLCAWDIFVGSAAVSGAASSLSAELAEDHRELQLRYYDLPNWYQRPGKIEGSAWIYPIREWLALYGCSKNPTSERMHGLMPAKLLVRVARELRKIQGEKRQSVKLPEPSGLTILPSVANCNFGDDPLFTKFSLQENPCRVLVEPPRKKLIPRYMSQQFGPPLSYNFGGGDREVNRVVSSCPGTGASWEFLSTYHRYNALPELRRPRVENGLWKTLFRRLSVFARLAPLELVSPSFLLPWEGIQLRTDGVYMARGVKRAWSAVAENVKAISTISGELFHGTHLAHHDEVPKLVELLGSYVFLFGRLFSGKNQGPFGEPRYATFEKWNFIESQSANPSPFVVTAFRFLSLTSPEGEASVELKKTPPPNVADDWLGTLAGRWLAAPPAEAKVRKCRDLLSEVFERRREGALPVEPGFERLMDLSQRKGVFKRTPAGTIPYYRLVLELLRFRRCCKETVDKESLFWSLFVCADAQRGREENMDVIVKRPAPTNRIFLPGATRRIGSRLWFYGASFLPSWFGPGLPCPPYGAYVGVYGGFYDIIVFALGLFEGWSFVEGLFGLRLRERPQGV